jgi:hypothetical protein
MRPLFSTPHLYQLRFVLAGISPMIWRRLVISSETSIAQLHEYIQIAFDWSGEHLHSFRIHGKNYGISYLGGISFDDNPNIVRLCCRALIKSRTGQDVFSTTFREFNQIVTPLKSRTVIPKPRTNWSANFVRDLDVQTALLRAGCRSGWAS